jgi:hypothetical protein
MSLDTRTTHGAHAAHTAPHHATHVLYTTQGGTQTPQGANDVAL